MNGAKPEAPAEPRAEADERPEAPALWDARFDALTEALVAELRRDLGPD